MTKEFKDYHLYLGCEILIHSSGEDIICKLSTVDHHGNGFAFGKTTDGKTFKCHGSLTTARLLLRPLSDMTEEEALTCHLIEHPLDKNATKGSQVIGYYSRDPFMTPEPFRYLLSLGFDIFNLIPAGLAIDKTQLTQQQ